MENVIYIYIPSALWEMEDRISAQCAILSAQSLGFLKTQCCGQADGIA